MKDPDLTFVIPTYRLRDVAATVDAYDEHFWRNGHDVRIVVFDDGTTANREKYYALLEESPTYNPVFYVGPQEKEQFLAHVATRLRDKKLGALVKSLFRPSYGGNRNCALMYTLGDIVVSADDDMRPHALMDSHPESLRELEIAHGRLVKAGRDEIVSKSFDILTAFLDVLGKPVSAAPQNHVCGELIVDSAMDLETNASLGVAIENSLRLVPGAVNGTDIVKMAQTFRSGTSDIDAVDFVEMFLVDEAETDIEALNATYVLSNFRPAITKQNWRMDCGVAGYDNTLGLPPFFPTRLRFEDYSYRLWAQHEGVASAHVDAVQTHTKNNYMRNPPADEIFNEEVANLLKRKIKNSVTQTDDLGFGFAYDGDVTPSDCGEILERMTNLHGRCEAAARRAQDQGRAGTLCTFGVNLRRAFYDFEPDFFQQNLARLVDDVVTEIKASLEVWPTLVEICFFERSKRGLPETRVRNERLR
jgi:glycosyltransferase involved in cell wall biosynthesis